MNKCNFCKHSIPTGSMCGWKCYFESVGNTIRAPYCNEAIETMVTYNNTRANGMKI